MWLEQREWSDEQHYGFWFAFLRQWPPPAGRRPSKELLGDIADFCAGTLMLKPNEIAEILCIETESLRRHHYLAVGDQVQRQVGLDRDPGAALATRAPLVIANGEDSPDVLTAHVPDYLGKPDATIDVDVLWERVWAKRRAMIDAGELRLRGALWVRAGDVAGALQQWRRLQAQADMLPHEIDELERDVRARAELPQLPTR